MRTEPIATYRVQLNPDFGFDNVTALVPYLKALGISHVYTSPYLQAAEGSTHGYDVVDATQVNRQLGGTERHARMCETIQREGLSHMIDVVPNHMAIPGEQNPWWWDVLENGPSSFYAIYFDVDWENSEERWQNRILLPVLGDHYGRILEAGEIHLTHNNARFALHYFDHVFPVDPSSLASLLQNAAEACGSESLGFLAESYKRMPRPTVTGDAEVEKRHRDKSVLYQFLSRLCQNDPSVRDAVDAEVARLNQDVDALDTFIAQQNYRLAFWRTASRDLGYRRFFDITDLVGLRTEVYRVFADTHALPISWVKKGWVQGLRIDHPDGLRDPHEYFERLRQACPDTWIVVEKILEPGERLRTEWPVEGTTGYEFLNLTGGLFVNPQSEQSFNETYAEFVSVVPEFKSLVHDCKQLILTESLQSELNRLSTLFIEICERHRRHRDYTRHDLHESLLAAAACFPVYRSYVAEQAGLLHPQDKAYIDHAIDCAKEYREDLDAELFEFLRLLLQRQIDGKLEAEMALRFQQLTGPAMAKGVEDTTFYRFNRLMALNEVGGDPGEFGVAPKKFHQACANTQMNFPHTLLASTTHDTKRSEDVRARLAALTEFPEQWRQAVLQWSQHNAQYRGEHGPDGNAQYLIYQTLVGAWPISLERMQAYVEKAAREAKEHTSWTQQNADYEESLQQFLRNIFSDKVFCDEVEAFVARIKLAGYVNSLAQTLIKLTAPGVPDIYQGTELWDFSLVDPDNRRPVDFTLRKKLLEQLSNMSIDEILLCMDEGLPKLWLVQQVLQLRGQHPEFFGEKGDYSPLPINGRSADRVLAYSRDAGVAVLVPRLSAELNGDWGDTRVQLPSGEWHNVLTGQTFASEAVSVQALFDAFPVALLIRKDLL